jgi:hypothetical protein
MSDPDFKCAFRYQKWHHIVHFQGPASTTRHPTLPCFILAPPPPAPSHAATNRRATAVAPGALPLWTRSNGSSKLYWQHVGAMAEYVDTTQLL